MGTTRLYRENTYVKEWDATITSIALIDGAENNAKDAARPTAVVTLDKTAFFPEGGGQSCDLGKIGLYDVIDVQEGEEDTILHTITLPAETDTVDFPKEGETLACSLDWNRRFDNMQRHCGEHILSGVFFHLFGGVNRGFHMGNDYMTIDISLEEDPKITEITYEDAMTAELEANKVIWSDAPVTVMQFDSRKEAEKMPLRKALAFDEDIIIVSVGSIENAADCVACCGTHPDTAGQVGLIKIFKVENYKGMFRIYFEAGQRALEDFRQKHDILMRLSGRYSSSVEDFPDKLKIQEERLASLKNELFHLKKMFMDGACAKVDALLEETAGNTVVYSVPQLSLDDVFTMGKPYMGACKKLLMLYSERDTSFILVSDGTIDCGALVKEYASFYQGKGGGSKVSARAIFTNQENADLFADLIKKHLQ